MDIRLREAITRAPTQALAILDPDGRIVTWNDAAARLTGHPADAATGRPLSWLRDDAATALDRAAAAPVCEGAWRERADGERFWCASELYALRDDAGGLLGFAESSRDASAEHAAIAEVDRRNAILAAISRSGMVIVITQDVDLRVTWRSQPPSGLGLEGYDEIIGRTEADVFPPEIAGPVMERKRALLASGAGERFDFTLPTADGTRMFDVCAEPLRDADDRVVGLVTISMDATAARAEASELRRSRRRLAEAETVAQIGSWEWDTLTDTVTWSDGLFALYGIAREDFGHRYQSFYDLLHPDDRQRMDAAVRHAGVTGGAFDVEHRAIRPDGHVRHVRSRGQAIVGTDGRTIRMTGTSQDITDTRIAETALQQAAATLTQGVADLQRATRPPRRDDDLERLLTTRQLEVLALLAEGMTNAEIASTLFLSDGTVKWHVRGILRALHLTNRSQAVARYLRARDSG